MKKIKLTGKYGIGKYVLVDDKDFEELNTYSWRAWRNSNGDIYAQRRVNIPLHRKIMGFPDLEVDHINGNTLDDRRCNLRLATHSENQHNSKKIAGGTSNYKGVDFCKSSGNSRRWNKWRTRITLNNNPHFVGFFKNQIDAALAYDFMALQFFGKFAKTNFGVDRINLLP